LGEEGDHQQRKHSDPHGEEQSINAISGKKEAADNEYAGISCGLICALSPLENIR
jgi:hypothetical protein